MDRLRNIGQFCRLLHIRRRYALTVKPAPSDIQKDYPPRGPMHQYRLSEATAFHCFRCGESKKSKLLTTYDHDWQRLLCNGCYGRLLSIYEIKAGTESDDDKAASLAALLLSLCDRDQSREAQRLFALSERRAQLLTESSLRFVATSEHLSRVLVSVSELDWSPTTIGLCKAFETEVVARIIAPLSQAVSGVALDSDIRDKDIGRVARYCADPSAAKPPELGTFAHFLRTALYSKTRRETSPLIRALFRLFASWPDSTWLTDLEGFYDAVARLTRDFRNRAAHTDVLLQSDYDSCRAFVIGPSGILWRLIHATEPKARNA